MSRFAKTSALLGALAIMAFGATFSAAEASERTEPNIVGWFASWGANDPCGPGGFPDDMDIWLVDDEDNEYYLGHTGFNGGCGFVDGTFAFHPLYTVSSCPELTCSVLYGGAIQPYRPH